MGDVANDDAKDKAKEVVREDPKDPREIEAAVTQAQADAAKAHEEARKAKREEDEASDELSKQKRAAATAKEIAEAQKATTDARTSQISALIPDFSKVQVPEAKVTDTQPLFGTVLGQRALSHAAAKLTTTIGPILQVGPNEYVLVTTEEDLATADAAYIEVESALRILIDASDALLAPPAPAPGLLPLVPVIGAIAGALPGLISMLLPKTSVSSFKLDLDSTAAVAAVAGALAGTVNIRLDDFRLVPVGHIVDQERQLRQRRTRLVLKKADRDAEHTAKETERAAAQTRLDLLKKRRDEATAAAPAPADIQALIDACEVERSNAEIAAGRAAIASATIDDLLKSIDAFTIAAHTVPTGASRSPFVSAALHEELHATAAGPATCPRVVLVKATNGSADQLYQDKHLGKDRFDTFGSVTLSYYVIDTATSRLLGAGVVGGTARLRGTVGGELSVTVVPNG